MIIRTSEILKRRQVATLRKGAWLPRSFYAPKRFARVSVSSAQSVVPLFLRHSCSFVETCPPWRIRGYKGLKIFENFLPQFPKKEVKGCFRQLNNKHYLGKSVSSVQTVVLCPRSQLVFIRGNLSAVADSWLRKKRD